MSHFGRTVAVAFAACGALSALTAAAAAAATAEPIHHADRVVHHSHGGRYMSTGPVGVLAATHRTQDLVPAQATYAERPAWAMRDDDSGNAKNPSLPSYAQNKGSETGGPGRVYRQD